MKTSVLLSPRTLKRNSHPQDTFRWLVTAAIVVVVVSFRAEGTFAQSTVRQLEIEVTTTLDARGAAITEAVAINDAGTVVGTYDLSYGFLYRDGNWESVDGPNPAPTRLSGINNADLIVGDEGDYGGFLAFDGQIISRIDYPIGCCTSPSDINNLDQVVGSFENGPRAGFLLYNGVFAPIVMSGASATIPTGINDAGSVVGYFFDSTGIHGFLLLDGIFAPIDVPDGYQTQVTGINDVGAIVGHFQDRSTSQRRGFLLTSEGFVVLDVPHASYTDVQGVNNLGDLVGTYRDASGYHGFIGRVAESRRPVVVIPGFMGTSLYKEPNDLIWLDLGEALFAGDGFLLDLRLDALGNSVEEIRTGAIFDESFYYLNKYGDLIESLEGHGFVKNENLFAFPWDWRRDIGSYAAGPLADLTAFIERVLQTSGSDSVDVIAHSAAGLLIRRYAQEHSHELGKVIYLGTPHQGDARAFTLLSNDDGLVGAVHLGLVPDLFLNRHSMAASFSTFPLVFETLPRFRFVSIDGGDTLLPLSDTYTDTFLKKTDWVDEASAFHASIAYPPHLAQFNIVGSGIPTLFKLIKSGEDWIPRAGNGDGSTLVTSAQWLPGVVTTIYVDHVAHSDLPKDLCVQEIILNILDEDLASLPICASAVPFPPTGHLQWHTSSPVTLTITDPLGRTNGVRDDDSVHEEIPFTSFFAFSNNQGGFVASDQEYRISVMGSGIGLFSFTVTEKDSIDNTVGTTSWIEVPVSHNSRGALTLFAGGGGSSLQLDVDGDGTLDIALHPNQSLTAAQLISSLKRIVSGWEIDFGKQRSLLAKLEQSEAALRRGNSKSARNILSALLNELRAQSRHQIAESETNGVADIVSAIMSSL